jgi:hypothetical protein
MALVVADFKAKNGHTRVPPDYSFEGDCLVCCVECAARWQDFFAILSNTEERRSFCISDHLCNVLLLCVVVVVVVVVFVIEKGSYVRRMRTMYHEDKLPPEQVAKLDMLGFDWRKRGNFSRKNNSYS